MGHPSSSRDDIWNIGIDNQLDLILELELAPFEPRDLQLVTGWFRGEVLDSLVELAVLGLERLEHARVIIVHLTPAYRRSAFTASGAPASPKREIDQDKQRDS
jgi:hypothetical protein